jgi:hypothetical protein
MATAAGGLGVPEAGPPPPDSYDFSGVLGGPLYQAIRRARLSGDALELLRRRILAFLLVGWIPLLNS